jgi:predicted permease
VSLVISNLRLALRSLVKRPIFATVALTTIAVGIAANTAIFGVVHAVLLQPLPYEDPGRLVTLDVKAPTGFYISTSIPNYQDWRDHNRVFATFGASAGWSMTMTGQGPAEVLNLRAVLGEFFETFGITPALGRYVPAAETGAGADPVVVLGHGFWQRQTGGDREAVGQTLILDGQPYVVVGVMPQGFGYPSPDVDAYFPMGALASALPWDDRESSFGTRVVARLAPNTSVEQAAADLRRVGAEVDELVGRATPQPEVRPLTELLIGDVRLQLWVLMGAVAFVLLIVCANIANLLLARGEDRRREMAVRTALGANRGTIVGQLLTESMTIAVAGGLLGMVLATPAMRLLIPFLPGGIPTTLVERISLSEGVLLFGLVLSLATGLVFGLLPALRMSQLSPIVELRAASHADERGRHRMRSALVVTEVALALVLLIGAGLLVQSLGKLRAVDKGFEAEDVLTARLGLPEQRYSDRDQWLGFFEQLLPRAEALPGARSAALSLLLPLSDRSWEMRILPEGVPVSRETAQSVLFGIVSPSYFETLGVPLLQGRTFAPSDRDETELVAIIDETMAARFWPGESAIGKRVTFELAEGSTWDDPVPVYRTVVGVAKNVRHYELASPSRIQVYIPYTQPQRFAGVGLNVLVKSTVSATSLVEPLRREMAGIDPDVPIYRVTTMEQYMDRALSGNRSMSGILVVFGVVALLLAAVGIFGVMSYSVVQRTREIGIRMAMGARGEDVVRWIARQGAVLGLIGIGLGLLAAVALTRVLAGMLFQVGTLEPVTYAGVALVLLAVATLAAYLPARRATRVDPVTVLKSEG